MQITKRDWLHPDIVVFVFALLCLVFSLIRAKVQLGSVIITSIQLWYLWLMLLVLAIIVGIAREGISTLRKGMKDRPAIVAILDSLPYAGAIALGIWGEVALLKMFGE